MIDLRAPCSRLDLDARFDILTWAKVFGGIPSVLAHSEGVCEVSVEHGEGGSEEDG